MTCTKCARSAPLASNGPTVPELGRRRRRRAAGGEAEATTATRAGITPITVIARPLKHDRPSDDAGIGTRNAPATCLRSTRSRSATAVASLAWNVRPASGGTPSTSKKRGCTVIDGTSTGSPSGPAMVTVRSHGERRHRLERAGTRRTTRGTRRATASSSTSDPAAPRPSRAGPGSANGSGRSSAASASAKMALLAPTPSASVATTMAAKPGARRSCRIARKRYVVEPRQYEGRLLHQLPNIRATPGDVYVELYMSEPVETNRVALFRRGTRVFEDISVVDELAKTPWTTRYFQGHIDAPFINLTPGTRSGIIHDAAYVALLEALAPLEVKLIEMLDEQRRAEEEQASRELLQTIQRAFRDALLALPAEEYDWFDIHSHAQRGSGNNRAFDTSEVLTVGAREPEISNVKQRQFFEYAGPLFSVVVSPASSVVRVGEQRSLRALPYDRARRRVETDLTFKWEITEGGGALDRPHDQAASFLAPTEPGLVRVRVNVCQGDIERSAEALITVTHELLPQVGTTTIDSQGLPGYTFERAPGESWRSKFDLARNIIIVNSGHRDFVYAALSKSLKLRYLVRLYCKELVLRNFVGLPADQLLERMVELSLRTEENL